MTECVDAVDNLGDILLIVQIRQLENEDLLEKTRRERGKDTRVIRVDRDNMVLS